MDKMQYPRGLIRYDTQNGMQLHLSGKAELRRVLRPRVLVYSGVLVLVSVALLASLLMRLPFKVDVVRDRGALARVVEDGWVENVYRLQIMNTTERLQHYRVRADGLAGARLDVLGDIAIESAQARWVPVAVRVPPESAAQAGAGAHRIEFTIERLEAPEGGSRSVVEKSTFMVPR